MESPKSNYASLPVEATKLRRRLAYGLYRLWLVAEYCLLHLLICAESLVAFTYGNSWTFCCVSVEVLTAFYLSQAETSA